MANPFFYASTLRHTFWDSIVEIDKETSKSVWNGRHRRLLRHEDEHGRGRVFLYAFVNEVVRIKTPFPFDSESAQVFENDGSLLVVDKEGRSIAIEHKCHRLCLSLDDKRSESVKQIKYKDWCYCEVILAWLAACIRYTSLQPELRDELSQYTCSIQRKFWKKEFCAVIWHRLSFSLRRKKGISCLPFGSRARRKCWNPLVEAL